MGSIKDRRIQKTHALLREALASLIHEKDYDAISVTEILGRANVGRSTFYTHFACKDELLVSGMLDMVSSLSSQPLPPLAKRYERIICFSLPIFEHVVAQRSNAKAAMGPRGRAILHEHLQRVLTELIADEVRREFRGRGKAPDAISTDMLARYVASTFVLVLNWWLERPSRMSPKGADAVFRALVLPTLASAA
jgi:AcrR family transcriptional regulator